ncbi:hypothetical protein HDU87_005325 [Geranomyces variabilis]|uniref:Thioesterase domain-containing protein n=1 Tax=Geranomyces variabilis TaxID=109894 RepID=A0AAD5TH00_9FUNG|nr:hypothetical protein HDU87_005325 [Geranomyces variabilis]
MASRCFTVPLTGARPLRGALIPALHPLRCNALPPRTLATTSAAAPTRNSRLHYVTALIASFSTGCVVTFKLSADSRDATFVEITDESEAAHAAFLQAEKDGLALVSELRKDPSWKEVDPYSYLSGGRLHRSFTAGTLKGKGKFAIRPTLFHNKDMTECIAVLHLGERLSGHDRVVHGGVLATLLDEMCARASIPSLPLQMGFTANLSIDYRKPVSVDQFVVLRSKLTKLDGRKAWAKARIESLDGNQLFVEANSLFVSPKDTMLALAHKWRAS